MFIIASVLSLGSLLFTYKVTAQTNSGFYFTSRGDDGVCASCTNARPGSPYCEPPQYADLAACLAAHPSARAGSYTSPEERDAAAVNRWHEWSDRYGVNEAEIAATVYDLLYPIGIAIGLFALITAGYAFMTSQGQPDKVKDAKDKLTASIVGILFIVLSIVILRVIIRTLLDPTYTF